jgi:glyoxylase-like metal-dependent hydrolase (beta-lactamase superfamily II)
LWEGSHRIDADLVLEAAPGHTPGSSVLWVTSGVCGRRKRLGLCLS